MTSSSVAAPDVARELAFSRGLQTLTNRIHATQNIDEIMLDIGRDACALFAADRLTIYAMSDDKSAIVSKVKTGLNSFKDLRLPVSEQSIAGFVALHRRMVNLGDVYDDKQLARLGPQVRFLQEVDKRTGYRTREMLVAPIIAEDSRELLGVVQLINHQAGHAFERLHEEGMEALTKTLAIAMRQRQRGAGALVMMTQFDPLVRDGVLSQDEMTLASRSARRQGKDLESVLLDEFQVSTAALGRAYASFFGADYLPFDAGWIKPSELLKPLKRDYCESHEWLPLEDGPQGLLILTPDPEKVRSGRWVSQVFPQLRPVYKVCTQREFNQALELFFGQGAGMGIGEVLLSLTDDDVDAEAALDVTVLESDNELVRLVNKIITDAHQQGASDIHIEPYPGKEKTLVRFRKDGSLQNYIEVPSNYRSALVARIKIMCDLDIAERRKPQDGKIQFRKFAPLDIELRVATLPTQGGLEDVVMRILASGEPLPLDKLALSTHNETTLKATISKPYGLFFVCGPTGSGKTTTLHSVLKYLNTPETKIWTAEDPVEITQKGLRQVQMNPRAGVTFATAMKAFLRADPDVIMVGEMRDKETTAIGIEASLTGHLVLATLHTNSAPESIIRLLDMGMDPFNFADALLGILAQRLAKRLCGCKQAYEPTAEELKLLISEYALDLQATPLWRADPKAAQQALYQDWVKRFSEQGRFTLYQPQGCERCSGTGYRGRVGLHELMVGSDEVKRLIQTHARVAELTATAMNEGMRTLKQDGIEKVLQGLTDLHQVRAVCIK